VNTGERVGTLKHLAEMDRLLRDIQAELLPDREPSPPLADGPLPEVPASKPQTQVLAELTARLVASMRELLTGYERMVVQASAPPPPPPPARRRPAAPTAPEAPDVTLSAGPFPGLDALREFEQAVAGLPGVREVAVQAYAGSDRAVIEVRLRNP
jgi:hypothetical protein